MFERVVDRPADGDHGDGEERADDPHELSWVPTMTAVSVTMGCRLTVCL